jgi:hypothetical protein
VRRRSSGHTPARRSPRCAASSSGMSPARRDVRTTNPTARPARPQPTSSSQRAAATSSPAPSHTASPPVRKRAIAPASATCRADRPASSRTPWQCPTKPPSSSPSRGRSTAVTAHACRRAVSTADAVTGPGARPPSPARTRVVSWAGSPARSPGPSTAPRTSARSLHRRPGRCSTQAVTSSPPPRTCASTHAVAPTTRAAR